MPPHQQSPRMRQLQHGDVPQLRESPRQNGAGGSSANGSPSQRGHPAAEALSAPAAASSSSSSEKKVKCVFLGDGAVGKTSLIVSYTTNGYPSEYVPTAIDTYDVVVHVDGEPVTFEMCDTAGQDDFDNLRPLVYPNTDVFLLCFSVVVPSSFHNIKEKWIHEIRSSCPKKKHRAPIVLVGTQSDLRNDAGTLVSLAQLKEHPVPEAEARRLAHSLGFLGYIESSSLTQKNLKEVFDQAIVAGLSGRSMKESRLAKKQKKAAQRQQSCLGSTRTCTIL